jgi:hypothetical protein
MSGFEDTQFYKEFGDCAWKVTLTDGSVKKSKAWLLKNEDVLYKEVTPHVPTKSTEKMSYVRSKSKTIITSK